MRAWRFYGFNDMRLDDVPEPVCRPGHVIVEPLCVQPSVTEAQLALGVRTLAYDKIKRRLETEAPVQLFGHEFSARIVEVGDGVSGFAMGDRVAARSSAFSSPAAFQNGPFCPRLPWSSSTIAFPTARGPVSSRSATASPPSRRPQSGWETRSSFWGRGVWG